MYRELKENKPHGTKEYSYTQYFIHNPRKAFHFPVHWHDEVELIFIKNGTITISIQNEVFHASAGDLFFVNSGELHFMESEDLSVEYYTILFPLEFISFQSEDGFEKNVMLPLRQKQLLFPTVVAGKIKDVLLSRLAQLISMNETCERGYQLRTKIILLEILECMLLEGVMVPVVHGITTDLQRELLTYVQNHYSEKITLAMLAEEFHLSEKYLSWYFKEHFSISFMRYVLHLRMLKAKEMLVSYCWHIIKRQDKRTML